MKHQHEERIGRSVTLEFAKRSCLDKRKYASKNIARDKAAKNKANYGSETKPYRCTLCGAWHLTTIRPKRQRGEPRSQAEGASQ